MFWCYDFFIFWRYILNFWVYLFVIIVSFELERTYKIFSSYVDEELFECVVVVVALSSLEFVNSAHSTK